MKSKDLKPSLWRSIWKRTTTVLKNMNWKTLIPKLALVVLALSAPAALSQEEILIITGKRMDKTVSYQISPNARELDFSDNRITSLTLPEGLTSLEDLNLSGNRLTSLTLPAGMRLRELDLDNNPIEQLLVPDGMNIYNLGLQGFSKWDIGRYTSRTELALPELSLRKGKDGGVFIVFSGGVLQAAERLSSGDWEDITNAVNPFYINPAEASQKFFRVRSAR